MVISKLRYNNQHRSIIRGLEEVELHCADIHVTSASNLSPLSLPSVIPAEISLTSHGGLYSSTVPGRGAGGVPNPGKVLVTHWIPHPLMQNILWLVKSPTSDGSAEMCQINNLSSLLI